MTPERISLPGGYWVRRSDGEIVKGKTLAEATHIGNLSTHIDLFCAAMTEAPDTRVQLLAKALVDARHLIARMVNDPNSPLDGTAEDWTVDIDRALAEAGITEEKEGR